MFWTPVFVGFSLRPILLSRFAASRTAGILVTSLVLPLRNYSLSRIFLFCLDFALTYSFSCGDEPLRVKQIL